MTTPRIYVGTYHKYNCGNLAGQWLDVEDYSDKDDFLEACAKLHADETDPEFMFQDHEGIPSKYIGESFVAKELWEDFLSLNENEREIIELYYENCDDSSDPSDVLERFEGKFDNGQEYVREFLDSTGDIKEVPEWLQNHIDFESIWQDWKHDKDTFRANGELYVFRAN